MAFVDEEAIRQCVAEILLGEIAGVRAILPDELSDDIATGTDPYTQSIRSMLVPTFEVAITYPPSDAQQTQPSDQWIEGIQLVLTVTWDLESEVLPPAAYRQVKSAAGTMAQNIRQKFMWPGSPGLLATLDGTPTGIISGVLRCANMRIVRDQTALVPGQVADGYIVEFTFLGHTLTQAAVT